MAVRIKKSTVKYLGGGLFFMSAISAFFLLNDEAEAAGAWWIALMLLLPGLMLALRTSLISIKAIALIVFFTQFITVPYFFHTPEAYKYQLFKPFGFMATDIFPIFVPSGIFLVLLVFFARLLSKFMGLSKPYICVVADTPLLKEKPGERLGKHNELYVTLIMIVVCLCTPLNLWMFKEGIGLTGVAPKSLPYHLSGVLVYLTKIVIPLYLGYLYLKTKRGLFITSVMVGYAFVLGLSTISRSAMMFIFLPVIYMAWVERKTIKLVSTTMLALMGYTVVSMSRNVVYSYMGGQITGNTTGGIWDVLQKTFSLNDVSFTPLDMLVAVVGRIEGIETLVLASQFDADKVGGAYTVILRVIVRTFCNWDIDDYHLAWIGYVLPQGFVSGGSLLSNVLMASNKNPFMLVIISAVVAFMVLMYEGLIKEVGRRYSVSGIIVSSAICFSSIMYFINAGSDILNMLTIALFMLLIISKFYKSGRKIYAKNIYLYDTKS